MKKIKCFLIVSLIVILALGVFVGCNKVGGVDRETYPNKITYCANGGNLKGKTERYLYVQDGVRAIEPILDPSAIIEQPIYSGYKFLGWAKGKVDSEGNPVLRDTPVNRADGGVWMNADGAISEKAGRVDPTAQHKYYDYDVNDMWNFSTDLVTEDIVLVAVWGELNKFIIANKVDGEWEDLGDLIAGNVTEEDERYEGYQARLYNVTDSNGTRILAKDINDAYEDQHAGYTVIKYYFDKEFTQPVYFPCTVDDVITVIYCQEIEGDYDIVDEFSEFRDAIKNNNNVYLLGDISMAGKDVSVFAGYNTYTGTILGNDHTISDISVEIKQVACEEGEQNTYTAFLGDLSGATIKELTLDIEVEFVIGINPTPTDADVEKGMDGTERDAICYVGMLARSMKGCTLEDVTVTAEYDITRALIGLGDWHLDENFNSVETKIPNTFEVEVRVGSYQAIESSNNTVTGGSVTVTEKQEAAE